MPRPARTFRDPQSAAKLDADEILAARALLPDFPPFLEGLEIGTHLPAASPGRLLVVRSGPWTDYRFPITAECRIRGTAYSLDADEAWDIASFFHGSFLAYAGDVDVVSYRYEIGPERGVDPDHRTPIAGFTVRARMRPAIL